MTGISPEKPGTAIIGLRDVCKRYRMGSIVVEALRGVTLDFHPGDYVSIMGPSGCGKSTLMNILGCLDRPTEGQYLLGGRDVSGRDDDSLSAVRGTRLGFVFQSYNLIQQMTVLENIELPLFYQGRPERESMAMARKLAARVGLTNRLHHKPFELSGGQQQRVAIARALVNDPLVILADEPTGNLDSHAGKDILELFDELHEQRKTIIMVTHDEGICRRTRRVVRLRDGQVETDLDSESDRKHREALRAGEGV